MDDDIASDDFLDSDLSNASAQLISEVAKWKLEAKSENNDRYFYHVKELRSIEMGERCYVIGRKGSGKTAISEYLGGKKEYSIFAEKLTFKNFPFNELYKLENGSYTRPNQYITIWKYVIYSTICRLMLKNENIDAEVRRKLTHIYGDDPSSLSRKINKWVAKDFSLNIFGISLSVSGQSEKDNTDLDWVERVNYLEDIIVKHIDSAKYRIIFDELDEDYRSILEGEKYNQYTALITSLFKAVQDIKSIFQGEHFNIFPVIFLRDDIYELIQDPDKNKWNDFKIELNWDIDKIRRLVAFRITRALDPAAPKSLDFQAAWDMLFGRAVIGMGHQQRRMIDSFEFIARSTYLRPRDFVKYLQACAQEAVDIDGLITAQIVKKVDKAFSNYLKDELSDELFAILSDISEIFDTISQIRKWNFKIVDFQRMYKSKIDRKILKDSTSDLNFILQILFHFSVIGNATRGNFYVFRYLNREARLNFNENIVVHRGLFKSLQII